MLYPNTQPSGVVGGGQDNKKRLQQLLSRTGAAPLFGSSGRSASVSTLPAAGASPLSFNPFLKMLQGHPGETLDSLPTNNPLAGFVGSSVPTSSDPPSSGGAPGPDYSPAPGGGYVPAPAAMQQAPQQVAQAQSNPFDAGGYAASTGHYNDTYAPPGSTPAASQPQPATATSGLGLVNPSNPFYHTLMQLALYGLDA